MDVEADPSLEPSAARFNDRLLAFALDFLLVLVVFDVITYGVVRFAGEFIARPLVGELWKYASLLLFIAYHAVFSSGGRRTAGKALLGIQVVGSDGEPAGFGSALGRSAAYLLSTAGLGLGYFWALGAEHKTWHDKLAGTRVVETREKSAFARKASLAAAWLIGPALAAVLIFILFGADNYAQMQMVANAQLGMKALVTINQAYKRSNGTYAPDLDTLLKASGHEAEFRQNLAQILDMSTVKLTGGTSSYALEGVALDEHRTMIRIHNAPVAVPPGS